MLLQKKKTTAAKTQIHKTTTLLATATIGVAAVSRHYRGCRWLVLVVAIIEVEAVVDGPLWWRGCAKC